MFGFFRNKIVDSFPFLDQRGFDAETIDGKIIITFNDDYVVTKGTEITLDVNIAPVQLNDGPLYTSLK